MNAATRRTVLLGVPAVLAAAAIAIVILRAGPGAGTLPDYALTAAGAGPSPDALDAGTSGAGVGRLVLPAGKDTQFEIRASPASDAGAHMVAYVFAVGEGEPNPVDATVEIAAGGSVRIRGRARALDGAREVRVVLGSATEFRRFEDALSHARDGASDAHVRVLVLPIVRER